MYLNSDLSFTARDSSNRIVGAGLIGVWERREDYEIIDTDVKTWHNTAAELAQEVNPSNPAIVWRDFQFQHVYNLCQLNMHQWKKQYHVWLGMLSLSASLRGTNFSAVTVGRVVSLLKSDKVLVGIQSNFKSFHDQVENQYIGAVPCGEVDYKDEQLLLPNGKRAFERVEDCQSIKFYLFPNLPKQNK